MSYNFICQLYLHKVLEKGRNSKKEISIDITMKNKNSQ